MANENIIIIGGGPAGLEAARGIADIGYKAILVEKRERLGGMPDEAQYATQHRIGAMQRRQWMR